jgi:lipopolysaccharide transport system permease protein
MADHALPVAGVAAVWKPTVVSGSASRSLPQALAELWHHRRLIWVFVGRDIKIRYKQTVLGATWAVLQPLLTIGVLTIVFSRLARVPIGNVPYPVFVLCGLLPWQLFSQGVVRAGNSLVDERYLLTKIYLPRMIMPLAAACNGVLDFTLGFVVLLGMMIGYRMIPGWGLLAVPALVLLSLLIACGVGLFLSALNVRYRDFGLTVPFFIQLWFFLTPVAYPGNLVPEKWRWFFELNPLVALVEGFRWALCGGSVSWLAVARSAAMAVILLVAGAFYFHRKEAMLADVV